MTSNSEKMTMEERLVQHIKDDKLMILMDDEIAVTQLVKKAINEALFTPQKTKNDYGRVTEEVPSPVVAAAQEIANTAIEKLVDEEVEKLKANKDAMQAIREAMALALPKVIEQRMSMAYDYISNDAATQVIERLKAAGAIHPDTYA